MTSSAPQSSLSLAPATAQRCDTGLALLSVSGTDAEGFLHGQFSNDLKALAPGQSQISSYSTAKGRVLALLEIARREDDFLIAVPADIRDALAKRLQMFVMRADVLLTPLDAPLQGLVGQGAPAVLEEAGLPVPEGNALATAAGVTVWRLSGAAAAYLLIGATEALSGVAAGDTHSWALARVAAGVPVVTSATQDAYVAQQLNLDRIGGINFKKGCYPGQEVIARMHYLGKPSRRLFAYQLAGAAPAVGTAVLASGGDEAGEVALSAATADGAAVLAVMKLKSLEAGGTLQLAGGEALTPLALPYTLEDASDA